MSAHTLRELSRKHGIELSTDQAEKLHQQFADSELSDMELETVAGAGSGSFFVAKGPGVGYYGGGKKVRTYVGYGTGYVSRRVFFFY